MNLVKDFNLKNIIYTANDQTLTFQFTDNMEQVCVGVTSVQEVLDNIEKVLIRNFCS